MHNPKFYIFGVPDGFNILSGTPDEILYFQLFYDTSKKGRELRINRKANGETVYSYLIYNLVACKGREGAFFGMSIAFNNNEYCNNPVALKELFEGVYNEVILKADDKDKIITSIESGNAVGRFCITKFEERKEMCEKIGRIIINNINDELAGSIRTIDTSFDNSKDGRILTLPIDADNISISQALHSYTWLSLSSEYKTAPIPLQAADSHTFRSQPKPFVTSPDLLSVHFIDKLSKEVSSYKDFIIQGLKGLVSTTEISTKLEVINNHLDTIEEYIGRQPELAKLKEDYISIYNELYDLKSRQQISPTPIVPPQSSHDDKNRWTMTFIRSNLTKIIATICVILVIVIAFIFIPTLPPHTSEEEEEIRKELECRIDTTAFNEAEFEDFLADADYSAAWNMLQKVADDDKQRNLKLKLQNSYRAWFNSELEIRRDNLQKLNELKDTIAAYTFNEDSILHNNLLDNEINTLKQRAKEDRKAHTNKQLIIAEGSGMAGSAREPSDEGLITIFKADGDYNYSESDTVLVTIQKEITCSKNACFVAKGATSYSVVSGSSIQVHNPNNGQIRIKANTIGQHKVKLNNDVYTFKVNSLNTN